MRRGEIVALRQEDVDAEQAVSVVRRSRVKLGGSRRGHEKAPKTEAGVRTVALPEGAVEALRKQWAIQARDKLAAGGAYHDEGYVFATALGNPLGPDDVSRSFRKLRDAAGLPRLPFHALRHTAVSVQIAAGVPLEIVSKRIGHRSISTTIDTYGHMLPEANLEAARKVDEFMRRAKEGQAPRTHPGTNRVYLA